MDENSNSVYSLITKLCEKVSNNPNKSLKKLRSKCYEILLSKTDITTPKSILEDSKDPICHMLAWKYELLIVHNRPQLADKLQTCIDKLEKYGGADLELVHGVLQLLFQFRKVPPGDCSIMEKLMSSASSYQQINVQALCFLNENKFKLPSSVLCRDVQLNDESFYLKPRERRHRRKFSPTNFQKNSFCTLYRQEIKTYCGCSNSASRLSCRSSDTDENGRDEGYMSPADGPKNNEEFWTEVSKIECTDRRTWENFGDSFPGKELPFITEVGKQTDVWALQSLALDPFEKHTLTPHAYFIKDVKYLLVGIASESFILNEHGVLYLKPGVHLSGITPGAIKKYCTDLLYCGNSYRVLNEFISVDQLTGKYSQEGHIFAELCESVKRHLMAYRAAALSLPEHTNLLAVHAHMRKLNRYMDVLASVCKVGPYADSREFPLGGALINYLCKSAMNSTSQDTLMVLCSVLFPCCQVYFNRFLQLWLLEGVLRDPYNEFFIKPNLKYMSVKGRNYWTRSYAIDATLVPEFLQEIKQNILACGKATQLLKLCVPSSPLCARSSAKIAAFMSCCLTAEQLNSLEQNVRAYYLEASLECAPVFALSDKIRRCRERSADFMDAVSRKRLVTLRRLELERLKTKRDDAKKKEREMEVLRAQYDCGVRDKHHRIVEEMREKMRMAEKDAEIQRMRDQLVDEEAENLIVYYENLNKMCEKKLKRIKKHTEDLKVQLEQPSETKRDDPTLEITPIIEPKSCKSSSSTDSFITTKEDSLENSPRYDFAPSAVEEASESVLKMHTSKSLDVINANVEQPPDDGQVFTENYLAALENFQAARRNRAKVMSLELGLDVGKHSAPVRKMKHPFETVAMAEAQRNKLRVMSSEFGIHVVRDEVKVAKTVKSDMEVNKMKIMSSNECFYEKCLDNMNHINQNIEHVGDTLRNETTDADPKTKLVQKPASLSLNLKPIDELSQPTPMSIDSTPLSDIPSTPGTITLQNLNRLTLESIPTTAATNYTDEGFTFVPLDNNTATTGGNVRPATFSKRVTLRDAEKVSTNCLQLFMQQSVSMPMLAQIKLANGELLKYFVDALGYFEHLTSLRDYFFLQDGEFSRNITEGLFERLYAADVPTELMNFRTLQMLVHRALNSSTKVPINSERLSFKINSLPKRFNLGDLEALDCLSLSYAVEWPLNLLLPVDTLAKYDEVFKYLLKLNRVSWVMKRIFQDMKTLAKQVGKNQTYLMSSPQFVRLHRCRHQMTHFIQTFQNYIIGEVLHTNWITFEENLTHVKNLDQLYAAHVDYLKNILFMCLLKQEAAPVRKIFEKIFVVILKFYDHLRSRRWTLEEGLYVHPNFIKLENIFFNFEDFVLYLFKVGQKIVKTGYQPHLVQLLDMLDVNGYYSSRMHYLKT